MAQQQPQLAEEVAAARRQERIILERVEYRMGEYDNAMKGVIQALNKHEKTVKARELDPNAEPTVDLQELVVEATQELEEVDRRAKEIKSDEKKLEEAIFEADYAGDEREQKMKDVAKKFRKQAEQHAKERAEHGGRLAAIKDKKSIDSKLWKVKPVEPEDFKGDIEQFPAFRQSFLSIFEESGLAPHQKLVHLKSCMKGAAGSALSQIKNTDADYQRAWDVLNKRYGDPTMLKEKLIRELNMMKPPTDFRVNTQRRTHDKIYARWNKLLEVCPQIQTQDLTMRSTISQHYSYGVREEIEKDLGPEPPVNDFLAMAEEIINRDIRIRGLSVANSDDANKGGNKGGGGNKKDGGQNSTNSNNSQGGTMAGMVGGAAGGAAGGAGGGGGQKKNFPQGKFGGKKGGGGNKQNQQGGGAPGGGQKQQQGGGGCLACDGDHYLTSCNTFKGYSVNRREAECRKFGVCFRCLRKGHLSKDCTGSKPCSVMVDGKRCDRVNHHYLLHKKRDSSKKSGAKEDGD